MKPFDIEAAKQGKPVVTRDGRDARIICFDRLRSNFPIVALIKENGAELAYGFSIDGKHGSGLYENTDIFMKEVLVERWLNLYPHREYYSYASEETANKVARESRIACVKITIPKGLL